MKKRFLSIHHPIGSKKKALFQKKECITLNLLKWWNIGMEYIHCIKSKKSLSPWTCAYSKCIHSQIRLGLGMTPDLRSKSTYTFTKLLTRIPIVLLVPAWLYNPLPTDTFLQASHDGSPHQLEGVHGSVPHLLVSISWVPSRSFQ